jgi:uncharacterized protein YcfJ
MDRKLKMIVSILCMSGAPLAAAGEFDDYARVTKVTPRIEEVNQPQQECRTGQPVRQCRTVDHWYTRTNGYAVTYEYRGHRYTTIVPYDPGDRLKVRVSVAPDL